MLTKKLYKNIYIFEHLHLKYQKYSIFYPFSKSLLSNLKNGQK